MTVKELKEILSKLDDDLEIMVDCGDYEDFYDTNVWDGTVRDISIRSHPRTIYKLKRVKDDKIAQRPCKETSGAKKCLVI